MVEEMKIAPTRNPKTSRRLRAVGGDLYDHAGADQPGDRGAEDGDVDPAGQGAGDDPSRAAVQAGDQAVLPEIRIATRPRSISWCETNQIRFLRKRYTDPLTGKDDWKPVFFGQAHVRPLGILRPAADGRDGNGRDEWRIDVCGRRQRRRRMRTAFPSRVLTGLRRAERTGVRRGATRFQGIARAGGARSSSGLWIVELGISSMFQQPSSSGLGIRSLIDEFARGRPVCRECWERHVGDDVRRRPVPSLGSHCRSISRRGSSTSCRRATSKWEFNYDPAEDNEEPQPQVLFTWGLSNLKPAASRVST
jgi:hypothetical protein